MLRRLAQTADEFPWGDPGVDNAALARSVGHPLWLAEMWVNELGRSTATAIMQANNEPAPLFLAYLPFGDSYESVFESLVDDGVDPTPCQLPGCVVAGVASAAIRSRALGTRSVLVADAGAQMAVHAVRPKPDQRIVELGAGRGTKSLMIAGLSHQDGGHATLMAVDNHEFKLAALRETVDTLGIEGVSTSCMDAATAQLPHELDPGTADCVLVDAPCSGLGTLRRHPDRRWRARPDEIESLAVLGERLLATAAELVKPGGFVVYSTCTVTRRENADVVSDFMASPTGRGFEIDTLGADVPAQWSGFLDSDGFFQSLPQIGGMDGHFVARLKRAD